ncbi:tRNA lysidine(34) synthetase TilS [Clostridium algidicarnis]|uniref:tRNA lysidine(34) synthetase TilS n=1 Tax=Clostridium algidicarnis TaxID=37659 RepID=UPI000495B7F2|nr:tRNA lysidine(34) synthetase TilS [Clostridium algidicarnis]
MKKRILEYIEKYSMIQKDDKVLVALSGGPDSITLLHILYSLKDDLGITLYAAHINHKLRGEASDKDERYVKEICSSLNIPCYVKLADINAISKKRGISSEMAGRDVRYDFFESLKKDLNINKVAVAHNSNDRAETILMRIMRGTGIEGLAGIKPVRDNTYIRPILILSRKEIEDYCEINKLCPRIDKTNNEPIYARNKVRLELIPYIKENFNKDIINTLNRFSELMVRDNDYLEKISYEKFMKYVEINSKSDIIIHKEAFKEHDSIVTRIIRYSIEKLEGTLNNIEMIHISSIVSLSNQGTGKTVNLPHDITVSNVYGDIFIKKNYKKVIKNENLSSIINLKDYTKEDLKIGVKINIPEFQMSLFIKLLSDDNISNLNLKGKSNCKYFDADKIKGDINVRYRKDGDKFIPYGMSGSRKLKDIFIDEKIPREQRDSIVLICFDKHIAWIEGYKVSELFKVEHKTKNILSITIERGESY